MSSRRPLAGSKTAGRRALLGGVASGTFASVGEAIGACVRVRDRVEPDPEWQSAAEDGYRRYRDLPLVRG